MRKVIKLLLVIAAAAAALGVINYLRFPYKTETARYVSIEDSFDASGCIIRGETVITSENGGIFEAAAEEGKRVYRGQLVGAVISGKVDDDAAKRLGDIYARIAKIKRSVSIAGIYSADDSRLDAALDERTAELALAAAGNDLERAFALKTEISLLLERKAGINVSTAAKQQLAALEEEKARLEAVIGSARKNLHAPVAGVFSANIDGLEGVVNPARISGLTPEEVKSLGGLVKARTSVGAGEAACKIVDNYEWFLVAAVGEETASALTQNESVKLVFSDYPDERIDAQIRHISPAQNGEAVLALRSANQNALSVSGRIAGFTLIKSGFGGLRVPATALRIKDGQSGVCVKTGAGAAFREVDIVYRTDDFALVKGRKKEGAPALAAYDEVLTDPKKEY